uniref:Front-end fatty acid desaturase group B n=1 Tax=Hediste diversicolor TaxID=126592 RepID=A0AAF0Z1V1_HEDDI|nr:front-end fatty acid desaturase group B [Hediste diversicolor]
MGKGTNVQHRTFSWNEVQEHTELNDRWIVIDNSIYDVSRFQKIHPGGAKIISHFAGQDATEVWLAMHKNQELAKKYMKSIYVGQVKDVMNYDAEREERQRDMEEIRQVAIKNGWFESNPVFFIAQFLSIVMFEFLGYLVFLYNGSGWMSYFGACLFLATAQAQLGWTMHDYGHWSVVKNRKLSHAVQQFYMGFMKGASKHWWNFRHNRHHAKTNIYKKDPDITFPKDVFLFGTRIPVIFGKMGKKNMPYNYEHIYFWLFGPAMLLPVVVNLEIIYYLIKRRDRFALRDTLAIIGFFCRYTLIYGSFVGGLWGAVKLYFFVRFLESFWFTMVTQMSHIPMKVDFDAGDDWLVSQTLSTQNIESSPWNDWFSGHLNFQIEHHLFPTMPRHNYHKVAPLVKSVCEKHHLPYMVKPMLTAMKEIISSLRTSGELWYEAYHHQ